MSTYQALISLMAGLVGVGGGIGVGLWWINREPKG